MVYISPLCTAKLSILYLYKSLFPFNRLDKDATTAKSPSSFQLNTIGLTREKRARNAKTREAGSALDKDVISKPGVHDNTSTYELLDED
jgi:hypothetical protein